jgi:Zn-dependent protease
MRECARCRTELPPDALACPACGTLVHADTLTRLAAEAEAATNAGRLADAKTLWTRSLDLLPPGCPQHEAICGQIASLPANHIADRAGVQRRRQWRGAAGVVSLLLLVAGKLKFLLLGLTKASTVVSMFAFFGLYWSVYGWPLALGLVLAIYIHEMGHVAMLRRLGIDAGAPLFIPGMGAFVMLKQHVTNPLTDAKIGLAGPAWGLGAALAALGAYGILRTPIWLAIAQLTAFLNLFNLIPVWQLDGSRGLHVLARWERWIVASAAALAFLLTGQRLLVILSGVAVWRAFQVDVGPGDTRVLAVFATLILVLALIARGLG